MTGVDSEGSVLSQAEWTGLAAFLIAVLLSFADVRLAAIPLSVFLLLCLAAPFSPRSSFYLPTISRGKSGKRAVALTFDDGPDPLSTPEILRLLSKHGAKATFFVTGRNAAAHPELIREMVGQGHSVGNHTCSHDVLILFRNPRQSIREIRSTQKVLGALGIRPLAFRPPAGATGPGLRRILKETGLYNVNFSCRGFDGGNRRIRNLSERILRRMRPDDIILLHDIRPKDEGLLPCWLNEIELILSGIEERGFTVLPLPEIIGRPVMRINGSDTGDQG